MTKPAACVIASRIKSKDSHFNWLLPHTPEISSSSSSFSKTSSAGVGCGLFSGRLLLNSSKQTRKDYEIMKWMVII